MKKTTIIIVIAVAILLLCCWSAFALTWTQRMMEREQSQMQSELSTFSRSAGVSQLPASLNSASLNSARSV